LPLNIKAEFTKGGGYFSFNPESFTAANTETPWVFASGARGLVRSEIPLIGKDQKPETYTVRLYFVTLENDQPGQRIFDIKLQDKTVQKDLDVVARAGGAKRTFMAEFHEISVSENLVLELAQPETDATHAPLLSGIELLRTDAKEITKRAAAR
jgi:hypothetical protein